MRNLKLTISYDGYDYHGWQVQPGVETVQGVLASAIESITGEKLLPQGSGRTDAGVHALAQVASFQTASPIPPENFRTVLNARLPASIRVLLVEEVEAGFHARHSARAKSYEYRIYRGNVCPPFQARYATHYPYPLNERLMAEAAALVVGQHDFTSFAAVDRGPQQARFGLTGVKDPERSQQPDEDSAGDPVWSLGLPPKHVGNVRTIFESRLERQTNAALQQAKSGLQPQQKLLGNPAEDPDLLVYHVRGDGFLQHMVRNLVGTFLLVGKGMIAPEDIPRILELRSRSAAGPTAPPNGLFLVSVEY